MRRRTLFVSAVLSACLVAASAAAQTTGGSAGGGDWGSSSSGGGGSSSGSSSWGGSSSSSSGGGGSSNAYEPPVFVQCIVFVAFIAFIPLLFIGIRRGLGRLADRAAKIDVSFVQIAIDARARRFVQSALAKMVETSDTASQAGLAKLLHAAASALGASKLAWIYAGSQRLDPMPPDEARSTHTRLAVDARSRFQNELVRAEDGTLRTEEAKNLVAREQEGEGVVVVTFVVAARKSLRDIDPSRVDEIEKLLGELSRLSARELVALELVWSPAAENDRMSTAELEARYPEMKRLTEVGGRAFCTYCAGPHAAELGKCPHCGAPTS